MADTITVSGKLHWAHRLFKYEEFTGPDGKIKKTWNVQFYPDDVDIFYALQNQGLKNKIKKDEDGYNLKLSREVEKETKRGLMTFVPPEVSYKGRVYDGPIGNGSRANVTLEVREYTPPIGKKAKAIRLKAVDVTELVEFNRDAVPTEDVVTNHY